MGKFKGVGWITYALFLLISLNPSHSSAADSTSFGKRLIIREAGLLSGLTSIDELRRQARSGEGSETFCKYPASAYLSIDDKKILGELLKDCSDLNEFRQRVPFQNLSLVFAAEDISSPASNMGHIFLQVSGKDANGAEQSYGISFLTHISGNSVALGYSLLFGGRDGVVTLGPANQEIAKYVDFSKRTVWISSIDSSHLDLEFMQLYLWELRQNPPQYFFIQFNCATFIEHLLSLSSKSETKKRWYFQTPRELFSEYADKAVSDVQIHPSVDWFLDALKHQGEDKYAEWASISNEIFSLEKGEHLTTSSLLFASHYTEKLRRQKKLEEEVALARIDYFQRHLKARGGERGYFVAENVMRPWDYFPPNKLSIGRVGGDVPDDYLVYYRPAAIDIHTEQPMSFGLQENVLAGSLWSIKRKTGSFRLEQADVFSMSSLKPWSQINPTLSFRAKLGFSRMISGQKQTLVSYKSGLTGRLFDDVLFFGLLGGGVGERQGVSSASVGMAEVGVKVNLISGLSLFATKGWNYWGFSSSRRESLEKVIFHKKISRNYSVDVSYQSENSSFTENFSAKKFSVSVAKYF
ncbi:DUF4105 domain-containing protein [Alphaproteobacteria bacterium]|nr:DUF4105 domain-containing protein [Alphaproteobacteria bacterium]